MSESEAPALALEDLARTHAVAALATLSGIMMDETAAPAARISAANALLQWGFGRPAARSRSGSAGGAQLVRLSWAETKGEADAENGLTD
ncbi:MAG: hypothetical protein JNL25_11615 [Rhodospirillaceae bacterium]|nr:hypothetical protein [Rhodospirillaceae bacterium]